MSNRAVLGQVFNQGQIVQAHSQKNVPCVLSSSRESVVCWPPHSNTIGQRFHIMHWVIIIYCGPARQPFISPNKKARPNSSPPCFTSPPTVARTVSKDSPPKADENPSFTPFQTEDQCLAVSQSFKAHDIVKVLCAAIYVA